MSKALFLLITFVSFFTFGEEVKSSSSKLSFECKAIKDNVIPINKLSDIKGDGHLLLDEPSRSGKKQINQKFLKVTGNISYISVDNSTRVHVDCLVPKSNYVHVRVVKPEWLTSRKGWVKADVLTASLSLNSSDTTQEKNKDRYVVTYDTRKTYESQTVEFVKTKAAFCGSGAVRGIRGKGTLKVFNPDKTMTVELFPCSDEIQVKLPDGRVLYLREAI